jgi:hypothetical protein
MMVEPSGHDHAVSAADADDGGGTDAASLLEVERMTAFRLRGS